MIALRLFPTNCLYLFCQRQIDQQFLASSLGAVESHLNIVDTLHVINLKNMRQICIL